jgi:hypothetical protein
MTSALAAPDFSDPASPNYHGRWIYAASFIDKLLWYELKQGNRCLRLQLLFLETRDGLLSAFPLWDVDRSLGNSSYGYSNATAGMKWWWSAPISPTTRACCRTEFVDRLWNRWTALRRSHLSKERLFSRIESAVHAAHRWHAVRHR